MKEVAPLRAAQHLADLAGELQRGRARPVGQHAGVHHQPAVLQTRQRLLAQPVEQCRAVGRLQDALQRIAPARRSHAHSAGQQMQVVVAQHRARCILQGHQSAQHAQRMRAAVDQIAQGVERVAAGREIDLPQQLLQRLKAAL